MNGDVITDIHAIESGERDPKGLKFGSGHTCIAEATAIVCTSLTARLPLTTAKAPEMRKVAGASKTHRRSELALASFIYSLFGR